MKKFVYACCTAGLVLMAASSVWAGGIFVTPGTRANAMGAAYIGIADDPTAIYWNPAGLSQLRGNGVQVSGFYLSNSVKSNESLNNVPLSLTAVPDPANNDFPIFGFYPTEPSTFSSKEFKTNALVPFVAGYTHVQDVTVALGFYASGGGGGKWEDTVPGVPVTMDSIHGSVDAMFGFLVGNVSASKEILPKLSVGLGFDAIYMTDKANVQKSYTEGVGSPLALAGLTDYSLAVDKNASGYGYQANAGVLYRMYDNLRLGAVIRSGSEITLSGKATYDRSGLEPFGVLAGVAMPDVSLATNYTEHYIYPLTYGIGGAYEPTKQWTIGASFEMDDYRYAKTNFAYDTPIPLVLDNVDAQIDGKNVFKYLLGAEYRYTDNWAFQAGLQNDPAPYSRDKLTLLSVNQYDNLYASLGASYSIAAFRFNVMYARGFSDKPSKGTRSYEYPLDAYRLEIGYTF